MSAVLIFGASRNVGFHLARILRLQGKTVYACLRSPEARSKLEELGVEVRMGDAMDPESLESVFGGLPTGTSVVSTLGGRGEKGWADSTGNINLVTRAEKSPARRFILVTSIGCGEMGPHMSDRARQAFGHVIAEKTKAEDYLRASKLDYTIIRPGGLLNDAANGNGILVQEPAIHGMISREDVARLIAEILESSKTSRQVFACVDRHNCRCEKPFTPYRI